MRAVLRSPAKMDLETEIIPKEIEEYVSEIREWAAEKKKMLCAIITETYYEQNNEVSVQWRNK